jgi:hypothetical protein
MRQSDNYQSDKVQVDLQLAEWRITTARASLAQLNQAYEAVRAHGLPQYRHTVSANMLTTKAMVAKSAFVIGASNQYEFAVNGKVLVLTQKPSGAVIKLVRIE